MILALHIIFSMMTRNFIVLQTVTILGFNMQSNSKVEEVKLIIFYKARQGR